MTDAAAVVSPAADDAVEADPLHPADVVSTNLATLRGVLGLIGASLAYANGEHGPLLAALSSFGASEKIRYIGDPENLVRDVIPNWANELLDPPPADRHR